MDAVPDPKRAIGTFGAMAKVKASSLKKLGKNPKLGKSKNKIARKGKAAKKLVNNSSKTAGRKIGCLLRVWQPQPLGGLGQIQEAHVRKTRHTKIRTCFSRG